MCSLKLFLGLVLLASVNARNLFFGENGELLSFSEEGQWFNVDEEEQEPQDAYFDRTRTRRDVQGSVTLKSDGGMSTRAQVPIAHNENNVLSAVGSMDLNNQLQPAGNSLGLQLDNIKGHSLSVSHDKIPGFGKSLTAAGSYNIVNTQPHDLNARAFVSRNMPDFPGAPNFNTVGGGLNYMYDKKIGASLGMAHTPFLDRKDYSAMGNFNVFKNPTSSVDFNAGFKKFDTPFMKSGWEPNFGLTFSRSFGNH